MKNPTFIPCYGSDQQTYLLRLDLVQSLRPLIDMQTAIVIPDPGAAGDEPGMLFVEIGDLPEHVQDLLHNAQRDREDRKALYLASSD